MAKLTFLQMVNRVLIRVPNAVITDVTAATGNAEQVTQYLNEAQDYLFSLEDWYSLYTSRTVATVAGTDTYAVAADFGRTIAIINTTNKQLIMEDYSRVMDECDPSSQSQSSPMIFALVGSNYRLWPKPAAVYSLTDKYWKLPTTLAANADYSDLPIECQNALIYYATYKLFSFLNRPEVALAAKADFDAHLKAARDANKKKIDTMRVMNSGSRRNTANLPVQMPSHYPRF